MDKLICYNCGHTELSKYDKIELTIEEYSPRQFIVRGDTQFFKEEFRMLNGFFDEEHEGWVFGARKKLAVEVMISVIHKLA